MLLFVDVDVLLEVPPALLTVVDCCLQFVLSHCGHVLVNIIGPKIVLAKTVIGHSAIASALRWLNIGPRRVLTCDSGDDLPDLFSVHEVLDGIVHSNPSIIYGIMRSSGYEVRRIFLC